MGGGKLDGGVNQGFLHPPSTHGLWLQPACRPTAVLIYRREQESVGHATTAGALAKVFSGPFFRWRWVAEWVVGGWVGGTFSVDTWVAAPLVPCAAYETLPQ